MTWSRERVGRTLREGVLTVGAILGSLAIVVAIGAVAFGLRPLVFRSGSMSPTIGTGDLALAHQVDGDDLRVGQIVSVMTARGDRVTHRIVEVSHESGGVAVFRMRGDGNKVDDAETYRVTRADKVLFSVPGLGYAVAWLSGATGRFLLGLYAAFLLMVLFRRSTTAASPERDPAEAALPSHRSEGVSAGSGRRARDRSDRGVAAPRLVVVVLAFALSLGLTLATSVGTWAVWANDVILGASLTAYEVPAPDGSSCAAGPAAGDDRGVELTWPAPPGTPAVDYTFQVSGITATTTLVTSGGSKKLQIRYDSKANANKNKTVTVTATAYVTQTPGWTSPTTTWKFRTKGKAQDPVCGDASAAAVTLIAPDGATRTPAQERAFISGTCTFDIAFCGTIDDASTIAGVTYVLQRVQGATTRCFRGSSWGTNCSPAAATTTVYQNQLSFYLGQTTNTVYPNTGTGSYTLTITVTDSWDNVTTQTVGFSLS